MTAAGGRHPRRSARRGTRVPETYAKLRELIVGGQIAPGARIIETDIAQRLNVSRTPVRGALQRLQQEGYIISLGTGRQARLTVAPLTQEDARELFGIVAQLEGLAARGAADHDAAARLALVAQLTALNGQLEHESHESRPDPGRIFDIDQAFHRAYVEAGGGPRLQALHDAVKPQSERYIRLYVSALTDEIGHSVAEHTAIVERIAAADAAGAERAVEENWHNAAARLCRVIEVLGERGTW